jgi:hypothetical protein
MCNAGTNVGTCSPKASVIAHFVRIDDIEARKECCIRTSGGEMSGYIAILIALLALFLSGLTTHFNFFHRFDDIRAVVRGPALRYNSTTKVMEIGAPPNWIFINSGNRPAAIIGVAIELSDTYDCTDASSKRAFPYIIEPFVIVPGEILLKKFALVLNDEVVDSKIKKTLMEPNRTMLWGSVSIITHDNIVSRATVQLVGFGVRNIAEAALEVNVLREDDTPLTLLRRRKPLLDTLRNAIR